MPLILIYQAMEMQRERSLISGTVKMDVSSNNDNMSELRAAFSEIRIESQPTMEVCYFRDIFSFFIIVLKYQLFNLLVDVLFTLFHLIP